MVLANTNLNGPQALQISRPGARLSVCQYHTPDTGTIYLSHVHPRAPLLPRTVRFGPESRAFDPYRSLRGSGILVFSCVAGSSVDGIQTLWVFGATTDRRPLHSNHGALVMHCSKRDPRCGGTRLTQPATLAFSFSNTPDGPRPGKPGRMEIAAGRGLLRIGVTAACAAHNREVRGSTPRSAILPQPAVGEHSTPAFHLIPFKTGRRTDKLPASGEYPRKRFLI